MVHFARKHSNEDDQEDKGGKGENQHEDALHEPRHHVLLLVVDFLDLSVSFLYVLRLRSTDVLYCLFVLLKLLLEATGKLLHPSHHD